jgi:hypothetical protein
MRKVHKIQDPRFHFLRFYVNFASSLALRFFFSKGFSVISKAKKEDMSKRNELEKIYSTVNKFLKKLDDDGKISILNAYFDKRNVLKVFEEQKNRLKKTNYHLLIAGNRKHRVKL